MSKRKLPACVERYRSNFGLHDGHQGRWRQEKKLFRKSGGDPVEEAFTLGEWMGLRFRAPADPPVLKRYPPGKRRRAFEDAYRQAREGER